MRDSTIKVLRGLVALVMVAGMLAAPGLLHAYPAEVENIPPGQYVPVALRELGRATSSIHLTMYMITLSAARRGSAVYHLADALIAAHRRGVMVQVLLDRSGAWVEGRGAESGSSTGANAAAADYLRAHGVAVAFDDETTRTHAKVLVIDEATVLLGSANWSEASLTRNREATVLVRSPALARELMAQFAGAAQEEPSPAGTVPEGPIVRVPEAFLADPRRMGAMMRFADERAFDLYLAVVRRAEGSVGTPMTLDYPWLAAAIGLTLRAGWPQRYPVRRVLARLQERYGLLTYDAPWGEDPTVRLTALPGDPFVAVPAEYWSWGWDRRLTLGGKALYLVSRWETARASSAPTWFRSQETLAARYEISLEAVHNGLMTLRRQNLLEVEPSPLNPADFSARDANRYTPNPLYDPAGETQALSALEAQHGRPAVARATRYAAAVYEDHDVRAITRLIALEQEFGPAVVRRAVAAVGGMSGNNPKKTVGYLVRVIQRMGAEPMGEAP